MKVPVEFPDDFEHGSYHPIPVGRISLACGLYAAMFFRPEGLVLMVPKSALGDMGVKVIEDSSATYIKTTGLGEVGKEANDEAKPE